MEKDIPGQKGNVQRHWEYHTQDTLGILTKRLAWMGHKTHGGKWHEMELYVHRDRRAWGRGVL